MNYKTSQSIELRLIVYIDLSVADEWVLSVKSIHQKVFTTKTYMLMS